MNSVNLLLEHVSSFLFEGLQNNMLGKRHTLDENVSTHNALEYSSL